MKTYQTENEDGEGENLPWYVANEVANSPSYQVTKKRTARSGVYYECSEGCIRFSAYAICAHTLAVAEIDNRLSDFLIVYKSKKEGTRDLNALVHVDMPAGRGKKRQKARRNGRDQQIGKRNWYKSTLLQLSTKRCLCL